MSDHNGESLRVPGILFHLLGSFKRLVFLPGFFFSFCKV
jgi:hypothetical protein